jgi:hypothetical protein
MDKSVCMVKVLYTQKYLTTVLNFGSDSSLLILLGFYASSLPTSMTHNFTFLKRNTIFSIS